MYIMSLDIKFVLPMVLLILGLVTLSLFHSKDTNHILNLIFRSKQDIAISGLNDNALCTNEERKSFITKMCKQGGFPKDVGGNRLLIDRRRHIFQCSIPKAATTTWMALWQLANLNKSDKYDNVESVLNFRHIHSPSGREEADIKLSKLNTIEEVKNYTKFIVVRNPLDRVYSVYIQFMKDSAYRKSGSRNKVRAYLEDYNVLHGNSKEVTFNQFLELILNDTSDRLQTKLRNNIHWQPMSYSCDLCNIQYDYIIRLETMKWDSGPVLGLFGYPENFFSLPNHLSMNSRADTVNDEDMKSKVVDEYKAIRPELYSKFRKKYLFDLQLLGYDFDMRNGKSKCEVKLASGHTCC